MGFPHGVASPSELRAWGSDSEYGVAGPVGMVRVGVRVGVEVGGHWNLWWGYNVMTGDKG